MFWVILRVFSVVVRLLLSDCYTILGDFLCFGWLWGYSVWLFSPSRILRFCDHWIYRKIKQTPQFSQELSNFCKCHRFSAYFGLRCVPLCHRIVHCQVKVVSHLKKWNEQPCVLIMPDLQELLVWAVRRRPFICSEWSRRLLSITRHHYTQRWEIQWRK